jgi:hypothetical protein
MSKVLATTLILAFSAISHANAENINNNNYMEAVVLRAYYKEPSVNFYHGMLGIRYGRYITDNFSVEGLAATNITTPHAYFGSVYVTAKVSSAYGLYLKGQAKVSDNAFIYGKIGYTNGTVSASAYVNGYSASAWSSGTSPSFGGGMQFDIAKNQYLGIDYMSYYDKKGITISGPAVNYGVKF